MFKNYIVTAVRNILKYKIYSFINILGLAVGIALCILIFLFIQDELSYDAFHEHADRIYRVAQMEDHNNDYSPYMTIGGGVGIRLKNDYPEAVEEMTRLMHASRNNPVWTILGDRRYKEDKVFVADEGFFDVFSFEFLAGDRKTALKEPNSVVIPQEIAKKYFGNAGALGKIIKIDMPQTPDLKVTGVIKNIPSNSHMHFDLLVSLSTLVNDRNEAFFKAMFANMFYTYLLLKENYPVENLEKQLPVFLNKHLNDREKKRVRYFYLQSLLDIHLHAPTDRFTEIEPENAGSVASLYVFGAIGFLTLVIACINFMNLATARYANRAREVGLRKVVGSTRGQLIGMFIGESLVITFIALPVALLLARFGLPTFNYLAGKTMVLDLLANPQLILGLVGIILFVGFFSGSYPAFFLSAFSPVNVLKGSVSAGSRSTMLRKVLVIGQFTASIALAACAVIVWQQLDFMRNKDLGYTKDNIVEIKLLLPPEERVKIMEYLKNEYLKYPGVKSVSLSTSVPGDIRGIARVRLTGTPEDQYKLITQVPVGYDFIKILGIKIIEGRDFDRENTADLKEGVIVNEKTAQNLGLQRPVVGKQVLVNNTPRTIVGVYKDVHWEPKRREIFGMAFVLMPNANFKLVVKLDPKNMSRTLAAMKELWDKNVPTRAFEYTFLSENIDNLYKQENRLSEVVKTLTILAIIIACLGLFGLASFTAQQRTKEIGIRKVLGASAAEVVLLLSKEYSKLIIIANIIAVPIVIYAMSQWLRPENFFYRISIGLTPFVISTVLVFIVAFFSVIFQSVKAALSNPVDAIKYE